MNKPEYFPENERNKMIWDFEILMDSPIQARRLYPVLINKNKRTCHIKDFDFPHGHRVRIKKKIRNLDKFQDLFKILKKLWSIKITEIPIVDGDRGTFFKNLEKKANEQIKSIKIIQTTEQLKST